MSFITSLGDWLRKITRSFASASISGQNITLTRHNGDTVVLTTQDTVNNAFTKIKLGTVTLEPDSTADTLTLGVGAGISLSANATNNSITVSGVLATQSVAGIMSTTDKTKLDGIATGAEVNQNAFSNVKVGTTTVTADTKTDTLELVAGNNVTITPDASNNKITIAATDITYTIGTASGSGNAITALSISGDTIIPTLGKTFSESDHTHPYLPLSGGTMTGTIISNSPYLAQRATNDSRLIILGCSSYGTATAGAILELRGGDYAKDSGIFSLRAGNANGYKYLIGKSNGSLTWSGYQLSPLPISSSNVGHFESVSQQSGVYSLPSGGTWLYFLIASLQMGSMNGISTYTPVDTKAGIAAGGTQVFNNATINRIDGFIWRLA